MRNDIKLPPETTEADPNTDRGPLSPSSHAGDAIRPRAPKRIDETADARASQPQTRNSPYVEARDPSIRGDRDDPTVRDAVTSDGDLYETPASRRSRPPHLALSIAVIAVVAVFLVIALVSIFA